jgi:hypothetical protein
MKRIFCLLQAISVLNTACQCQLQDASTKKPKIGNNIYSNGNFVRVSHLVRTDEWLGLLRFMEKLVPSYIYKL